VLYICNEYPPAVHGGIGTFVRALAEQLAVAGHDVAVIGFASHVGECLRATENGVRIVRLPWPRSLGALRLGRFRIDPAELSTRKALSREAALFAAQFRPDVVESHDWSGPLGAPPWRPLIVRLHGASSVHAWSRGNRAGRLLRFFERRNLRMADAIAAPSQFIASTTFEALRLSGKPCRILHHGVDTERFRPDESGRDPNGVLFAGTVKKQKGIQELFGAIPRILDEFPQARFTIAGRYPEDSKDRCSPQALLQGLRRSRPSETGPDSPAFETQSTASAGSIHFLGHVPQARLASLYSSAAVAVFPSHNEAFGLACAEAMACGAAVVMTARGSGPELVEHGESGLLVEPTDIGALATAVVNLLKNSPLRGSLGAAARSRVLETFDLRDTAALNVAFYEQVARRFQSQPAHA
jgi:glycosyltransferase involved in cell wall biosynthesis